MIQYQNKYLNSIIKYVKTFSVNPQQIDKLEALSSGLIFSNILKQATYFRFQFGEISQKIESWVTRLRNLRVVIKKIQNYFEKKIGKGIKTKDINLISIAYNQSPSDIIKFFEVVLAVMIQAPNKQLHIQKIMAMDQQIQTIFVEMIQKIIQERILDMNQRKQQKIQYILQELQAQNSILRQEISNLQLQKDYDSKELQQLKMQVKRSQSDFESFFKSAEIDSQEWNASAIIQNQNLKNMIQVLKKKISKLQNDHQVQVFRFKQEIHHLQMKVIKMSELEEILQIYKEKYNQNLLQAKGSQNIQKQRVKYQRIIQQKEGNIKKLQTKIDQLGEQIYTLQQRQVYLHMQLQKRQVRFKQLQKQVKKTIKNNQQSSTLIQIHQLIQQNLSQPYVQLEELQQQVHKLKIKQKQAIKDKTQLKRTTQRHKSAVQEKKKLQMIIFEMSKQKRQQLLIVLTVLYDLSQENKKIKKLLQQNQIQFDT